MKEIIKNSKTITEAIKQIYGYDNGKSRKKFYEEVENKNINIEHLRTRELIDELIDLFPNKDYDSASSEVMDYISQSIK